eukprot:479945_1
MGSANTNTKQLKVKNNVTSNKAMLSESRIEILEKIFGADIPFIIMIYLSPIYSIYSESILTEINYTASHLRSTIFTIPITCKIYFNRTNDIALKNNKRKQLKIPFQCVAEISIECNRQTILQYQECQATISTIFVDTNTKLNVESTECHKYKKQTQLKIPQLMECIRITLEKPTVMFNSRNYHNTYLTLFKTEYLVESSQLNEYLCTHTEYGPISYLSNGRQCNVTFSNCPP